LQLPKCFTSCIFVVIILGFEDCVLTVILHMRCISIAKSSYFRNLSATFLINSNLLKLRHMLTNIFLFINTDYDGRLSVTNGSVGLHLFMPKYGTLLSRLVSTNFGICSQSFHCLILYHVMHYYYYYHHHHYLLYAGYLYIYSFNKPCP